VVRLSQIVDKSRIIKLQQMLTNSLGMSIVFEEPDGTLLNVIGSRGGVCEACTKFIDTPATGRDKCLSHDSNAAFRAQGQLKRALASGSAGIIVEFYVCNGRLRNFVIPISIGGEVLGNIFAGQFLVTPPKRQDPRYEELIKEMEKLGMSKYSTLSFAKLPTLNEIPQIAEENNIPQKHYKDFEKAF